MASRTEYEMLWKLGAELGKDFNGTFTSAQNILKATQNQIQALNQEQKDITAYTKQQESIEKTKEKLELYQRQLENVQQEMSETTTYSSDLANKEETLQYKISQTEQELEKKTQKLDKMGSELQEAGVDMSDLAKESDRLQTEIKELQEQEEKAGEEAAEMGDTSASAFDTIATAIASAGIVSALKEIYEAYSECVSIAADFQSTMSTVEALSGATESDLADLTAEAKELGATTKYTATEVAEAMTYMGMAGWSAEEMMSGMDGVLQLAAASGEDLATVSDIVTDNLTAFGLSASDTARFADVLAAAATNSNTSVSVMGETFKNCASIAGALGYTIEDVSVAVGLMANAGVKGSNAGTALKNTFNGLLEGATLTSEAFGEVEISALNADGTMMSFSETVEMLRGYFDQMTEAEKVNNAMAIAGSRSYNGLLAIINATDEDYQSLTESINDCTGAASAMAEIQMDNLTGQVTLLNSAMDAVKTTVGEAYQDELQGLAGVGTDILTEVNEFLTAHPGLLRAVIAITAEVGLLAGAFTAYVAVQKLSNSETVKSIANIAKDTIAKITHATVTNTETAATVGATAAQEGLNVAMAANPIGLVITAVAALAAGLVVLAATTGKTTTAEEELTAASQAQKDELEALNQEYQETVAIYGETSYQAQELAWEIDELTASYEENKMTVEEYEAILDSVAESCANVTEELAEAEAGMKNENDSVMSLVSRLTDLTSQSSVTAAEQQEILTIIEKLNEEVPDLALSYDTVTNSLNQTAEAIIAVAEAELQSQWYATYQDTLVTALNTRVEAEQALALAQQEQAAAEQDLAEAQLAYEEAVTAKQEAYNEALERTGGSTRGLDQYLKTYTQDVTAASTALDKAQKKLDSANDELAKATEYYESNEEQIDSISNAMAELATTSEETADEIVEDAESLVKAIKAVEDGYLTAAQAAEFYGVSEDSISTAVDENEAYAESFESAINAILDGYMSLSEAADAYGFSTEELSAGESVYEIITALEDLQTAYDEAYEAAYESISGQYELWDEAAVVVPTDIETINNALETQLAYWNDYATDLESLADRVDDIDGLSQVLADVADGDEDAINAIAGMADATDDELTQMVEWYLGVKEQQDRVAADIAEFATGFSSEYEELTSDLEEAVDSWNLGDEATEAAKSTIEAYIQALKDGSQDAISTAAEIAQLVANALATGEIGTVDVDTGTFSEAPSSRFTSLEDASDLIKSYHAYASGTDGAESGLALVGEEGPELVNFDGGERVYNAEQTRALLETMTNGLGLIHAYANGTDEISVVSFAPLIAQAIDSLKEDGAQAEKQTVTITIAPTFTINGDVDEDVEERVRAMGDELVDKVLDAIEESGIDVKRGVYA